MVRPARKVSVLVSAALAVACSFGLAAPAALAAGTGTIAGRTFEDPNRNGVLDPGETVLVNHQLYLFDGAGTYRGTTISDGSGAYAFMGLADGDYRVEYASPSWSPMRRDWVPTTTGSVVPRLAVHLVGTATANFGWRPITRSTMLGAPMASYTGPEGLRVEAYNDAVEPKAVHDLLLTGSLVGPEAASTTIRLDYGTTSNTATSVAQSNGAYSGYAAVSYVTWDAWLDTPDLTLFHEYGHAWSRYYAFMVQQDGTMASYLQARGLAGDARVDSGYMWNRGELIAEDYRQLFGTPAAQAPAQANTDIPPAAGVPGLRDFLATTFRQAPAPTPDPGPPPTPALAVTGLSVSPVPVTRTGTVAFTVSTPASVTVAVADHTGKVVRTLLSGASTPAGDVSVKWDRKDASGRKVRGGTHSATVQATDAGGTTAAASVDFPVS